jgi:hypothetical protein|tara:strand:+ start:199 stop:405 length:207 start_codon:yes stop_codon:yes gene_type:complete
MSVVFEQVAHVRMPAHKDAGFGGWAVYSWYGPDQVWKCQENNEGFHKMYDVKWELTAKDMTALILKAG